MPPGEGVSPPPPDFTAQSLTLYTKFFWRKTCVHHMSIRSISIWNPPAQKISTAYCTYLLSSHASGPIVPIYLSHLPISSRNYHM